MKQCDFKKLPKKHQATLIAHDVINTMLLEENVIPNKMMYYRRGKNNECYVCAQGAAFLAHFRRIHPDNKNFPHPMELFPSRSSCFEIFGRKSLIEIERLFEGWDDNNFARKFPSKRQRIIELMRNYLFNKGKIDLNNHPDQCVIFHKNPETNEIKIIYNTPDSKG